MKKLASAIGMSVLLATGCAPQKSEEQLLAEATQAFVTKCKASGTSLPGWSSSDLDRFCTCSSEKLIDFLGPEAGRKVSADTALTDAQKQRAEQIAVECMAEIVGS